MSPAIKCLILLAVIALFFVTEIIPLAITAIGGAPFIGLKSLVVKAHGSSNAKAFKNAVRQCVLFAEADIIGKIKDKI